MVPGNLFSAAALAASVYLPEGRPHSRCEQSEKNEFPGRPPGQEAGNSGCQKRRPEAGGQRVGKRWIVGQQWWKSRRKALESGSDSGGKWVRKWWKVGQQTKKRSFNSS